MSAQRAHGDALVRFAEEVGPTGPVAVRGGGTQWEVGGSSEPGTRLVGAPVGGIEVEAAELIVRCGAGTTVAELDAALAEQALDCPLDPRSPERATVGGVVSVGHSGPRRLRYGHLRDLLLEARYVAADGRLVRAGAPIVKNVTGYDLCRLLVGSIGTIGLLGEVVLRCRPRATASGWWSAAGVDPFAVRRAVYEPSSILWDGNTTWVQLEGTPLEVGDGVDALRRCGGAWSEAAAPELPTNRWSFAPGEIRSLVDRPELGSAWVAEIGVGTVHAAAAPARTVPTRADLHDAIKRTYDPTGRLNPGRSVS